MCFGLPGSAASPAFVIHHRVHNHGMSQLVSFLLCAVARFLIYYKKRSPTKLNLQTRSTLSPLGFWDQSHSKRPTSSSFSVLHKSILASRLQRPTPVAPTPTPPPAEPAAPTPWHTSIRQTNEKSLALKRPKPALPRIHEPVAQRPAYDNNAVASTSSEHRPTPPTSPSPSIISISDSP